MPQETFNPIGEPSDTVPPQRPGTVVISYHEGIAANFKAERRSNNVLGVDPKPFLSPQAALAFAILVVILLAALVTIGLTVAIVLFLAAFGGLIALRLNARSPLAVLLFGRAPQYYLVDISRRTVRDTRRTQLKNPGIYVVVDFEYRVQVSKPVEVVIKGVYDVRDYLSEKFYLGVDALAHQHTLDKLDQFRDTLTKFMEQPKSDDIFIVDAVTFDVHLEGAPGEAMTKLSEARIREEEIRAQSKLDAVEREGLVGLIANDNLLLAEIMRSDDTRVQELLKMRMEQRNISFQQNLALFKVALETGVLEPHQIKRDFPEFFEGLTKAVPGVLIGSRSTPAPIDGKAGPGEN
jgi:hypothetical protein